MPKSVIQPGAEYTNETKEMNIELKTAADLLTKSVV
jgi:hypothetical protein